MSARFLRWTFNYVWNQPFDTLRDIIQHRSSEVVFTVAGRSNSTSKLISFTNLFFVFHHFYLFRLAAGLLLAGVFGSHRSDFYTRYDYFLEILFRTKAINTLSSLCAALLPLCALYVNYVIRLKRFNYVWRLVGEVMLVNPKDFFRLNPDLKPPIHHIYDLLLSPVTSAILLKGWIRRMWNSASGSWFSPRFYTAKLAYYPHLSIRLRLRLILVYYGTGLFGVYLRLLSFSILLPLNSFFIYYVATHIQAPWTRKLSFALECSLVMYFAAYCLLKNAKFFLLTFVPTIVLNVEYLRELNRLLEGGLNQVKKWSDGYDYRKRSHGNRSRQFVATQRFCSIVRFYRKEYATLLLDGLISDQQLVSSIALIATVSNAPFSQFLFIDCLFRPKHIPVNSLTLFGQFSFCALLGWSVIYVAERFYCAAKRLLPLPLHLKGESLRSRLQLSHLIEQVYCRNRKHRFAYSCGPFGRLTRQYFFEAAICYSGYALYTYGLFRKSSSITQYAAAHLETP